MNQFKNVAYHFLFLFIFLKSLNKAHFNIVKPNAESTFC